ncbi:unnamed protein product [Oncorhynchus mykiss]|uniref:polynucleotide adenylyltransferase n=1 Tax=Oncorhynchus mykiss TaxID=8022 RepID=A0A060W0Q1_ONCMY|nr:unnamed protein product [Oncorhynchus mykiss]
MDRRFHNLTLEQVQTLDQVLTEVIPIHGRGNFPTLEVRPKDIIHVVKDRLLEREIRVRDIRLNGSTASHVMVRDNGTGYRDLDIIFGVELPRQEDFQVIKEVVLGSLRDLLPRGVNRRKITCLTMKEAYVQKMVKVFNEHDRWSLISLSNNRGKTVGLRFVSSLRRQFEFSVDSFQIILDRMLESYWETERRQGNSVQEQLQVMPQSTSQACTAVTQNVHLEHLFPPPAKKTCNTSQGIVPDYCPSPKPPRKMSRKMSSISSLPEKWSLLKDLSDLTTQLFEPIEILPTPQPNHSLLDTDQGHYSSSSGSRQRNSEGTKTFTDHLTPAVSSQDKNISPRTVEQIVRVKYSKKPPDSEASEKSLSLQTTGNQVPETEPAATQELAPPETTTASITVVAECMYGDFEQAMDHLRFRLIATHNPEEIRGGGLLKYSDLLVRNFRPASETEIKSLERYMCSRFFIDFPDVSEQQRKIEAYLRCHFVGDEETSKYDYLMTLRRVIDESTVCLMGHERRQTLNMITVLALRVLGEQNAIPNTANVTCFYQPAPYMADPIFSSYYIPQAAQPPLLYHPYPLHVHMQTGLV